MPDKLLKWKVPKYSQREINAAGNIVRNPTASAEDLATAMHVIDDWRCSHAYPLHIFYIGLRHMAKKLSKDIIVAQRLKRLPSIITKLKIQHDMQLWRMQDLGGCRVVSPDVTTVYNSIEIYNKSRIRHKIIRTKDYIKEPRQSGYRSVHCIYKFHSDVKNDYNTNMLVEVQFRSRLQHLWATTVETMGTFTQQAIKSGLGSPEIMRFFALTSSVFAIEEGYPTVPDTPDNIQDLMDEITKLDNQYNFLDRLSAYKVAGEKSLSRKAMAYKDGYFILLLDFSTRHLKIEYFKKNEFDKATQRYNEIESNKNPDLDAVLVRVESFKKLKSAYPNYFSHVQSFVTRLRKIQQELRI